MKNLILPILLCLSVSCSKYTDQNSIVYLEKSFGEIIPLKFHNYKCSNQGKNSLFSISYDNLNLRNQFDFTDYNSKVDSTKILGSFQMSYIVSMKDGEFVKQFAKGRQFQDYLDFKPCENAVYDDFSYEAAALKVSNILIKVQKKSEEIISNIPKITVKIAPKYELIHVFKESKRKVHRYKHYLINNAGYAVGEDELIFYPQGIDTDGNIPFNGRPLWEIPMVAAHEYGHHIFSFLFPRYLEMIKGSNAHLCFNNNEMHVDPNNIVGVTQARQVTKNEALTAINEAFADMFAKYTLDDDLFNLEGLNCFEKTRDITSDTFSTGLDKKYSTTILELFSSDKKTLTLGCDQVINFQDPHMVGAVIAHVLDSIYNELNYNKSQKLKEIISWVKLLQEKHNSGDVFDGLTPRQTLNKSLELGIKNIINSSNKETVCNSIKQKVHKKMYDLICASE